MTRQSDSLGLAGNGEHDGLRLLGLLGPLPAFGRRHPELATRQYGLGSVSWTPEQAG